VGTRKLLPDVTLNPLPDAARYREGPRRTEPLSN
jgi:hypothetical protein